jgi:hypothetical protein
MCPLLLFLLAVPVLSRGLLEDELTDTRLPEDNLPVARPLPRQARAEEDCQLLTPPWTYDGTVSTTVSGRTCQVWTATEPHTHGDHDCCGDHNYCRNPIGDRFGVYCYTMDPEKRWEYCSQVPVCPPPTVKVLDFSMDSGTMSFDENFQFTSALLLRGQKKDLPADFTVCSAFMVENWLTVFSATRMFTILDPSGKFSAGWLSLELVSGAENTQFSFRMGSGRVKGTHNSIYFPNRWIRACVTLETITTRVRLVVDGHVVEDAEHRELLEDDLKHRPQNLTQKLVMGLDRFIEFDGKYSMLNIYTGSLSAERMVALTTAGGEECLAPGDILSWEEAEWDLISKAELIFVDEAFESPCRAESRYTAYTGLFALQPQCMEHCPKVGNGRSPALRTLLEWVDFSFEMQRAVPDMMKHKASWTSATEGDVNQQLARPPHWPGNIQPTEGVWRDYYTATMVKTRSNP